jgi:hypothetical protein
MKRIVLTGFCLLALVCTGAWAAFRETSPGEEMTAASQAFVSMLDGDQKKVAVMSYEEPKRLDWHFIPKPFRKGLQIRNMNEEQRGAALKVLRSALSQIGYDKATKIMSIEKLLFELEMGKGANIRDPERYYFTLFGEPTAESRWGLSVEGHHMSLNFVVEKGKVVSSSPQVFCANPAVIKNDNQTGIEKGFRLLAKEETTAFDLVNSLTEEQQATAIFAKEALKEVRAAGEAQPPSEAPVGLAASKMTDEQKKTLRSLIDVYCSNMPELVARERIMAMTEAGFDQVHFGWAGAKEAGIGHYYRVQGPTFLIEFVNTQPDAAGNPANHIHCIWRDMRGDFALPLAKGPQG